jgi:mannosyl-oligosaccharide alpha-1,2-mannosidase
VEYVYTRKSNLATRVSYLLIPTSVYLTDTTNSDRIIRPSHTFEHLSCFLPGLLALGARTLPLTNLASIGINLNDLAKDLSAESKADYARLSEFNLRDVHIWAAEGLAQACYLTYADQPSGLGPDEMVVYATPDKKRPNARVLGGKRWIDALDAWKRSGARGVPPGVAPTPAVVYSEEDRMNGPDKGEPLRDYALRKIGYLLRPEASCSLQLCDVLWD